MSIARLQIGDQCPVCKGDATIVRRLDTTDEIECVVPIYGGKWYQRHWYEDLLAALEKNDTPVTPVETKRVIPEFPHTCLHCGRPCYMGITPASVPVHQSTYEALLCDTLRTQRQGPAR